MLENKKIIYKAFFIKILNLTYIILCANIYLAIAN